MPFAAECGVFQVWRLRRRRMPGDPYVHRSAADRHPKIYAARCAGRVSQVTSKVSLGFMAERPHHQNNMILALVCDLLCYYQWGSRRQ